MAKLQKRNSPIGTGVNVGPGRDVVPWLSTDDYIDILHCVHLAGVLQDKSVQAWPRHTQRELELGLWDTENRKFISL